MNKETNNYYLEQLEKVKEPSRTIQITGSPGGQTNWMNLNDESASILVKWLEEHYNVKPKEEPYYQITHKNKIIFVGSQNECYFKLQRAQSQSADWAIKYEGYKVIPFNPTFNKIEYNFLMYLWGYWTETKDEDDHVDNSLVLPDFRAFRAKFDILFKQIKGHEKESL